MKSITRGPSKKQRTRIWREWLYSGMPSSKKRARRRKRPCRCDICRANRLLRKLPLEDV